jgi:hypothetical protein
MDFTSIFNSIVELMKDRRSDQKTDWGRWLGAAIVIDIMFMWTRTCIQKNDMIPLDGSALTILLGVFLSFAYKPSLQLTPTLPAGTTATAAVSVTTPPAQGPQGVQGPQDSSPSI